MSTPVVNVLFVCLGNICRSPTGEGVFRALIEKQGLTDRFRIDSAGTAAFHIGEPPDGRSQTAALRRGVDLSNQRARRVRDEDFRNFDYILAMDAENHTNLMAVCPDGEEGRVRMLLDFAAGAEGENVPDPYYTRGNGFEIVLDLIELATVGLLEDIRANHF